MNVGNLIDSSLECGFGADKMIHLVPHTLMRLNGVVHAYARARACVCVRVCSAVFIAHSKVVRTRWQRADACAHTFAYSHAHARKTRHA